MADEYNWYDAGSDFGNIGADFEQMPSLDASNLANLLSPDANNFLADLGNIGTDLGPMTDFGMDPALLESIGLPNLDWENYAFYEGGDQNTKDAYDRAEALKGDNIDVGGGYNPATGRGDAATAEAVRQTGVTGSASTPHLTTPSGVTPGPTTITPGGGTPGGSILDKVKTALTGGTKADGSKSGMNPMTMMMMMYLLSQMGKGGSSGSSQAVIPKLQANRSQLPYSPQTRPGAGGRTYFNPTTYTPAMAGGGAVPMGGGGISSLGSYSDGGRLLKGPGDGVSDQIPATIAGKQPARLANGEFVVPARIVSELGNGSTDAGAKRLYEMMDRVQKLRRKTKNVAANTKAHKYLPA
jgi:hypothetical protein